MGSSVEVVRGIYEAFGRGDVAAVLGAMTDEIEWHEAAGMPYGGVHRGPQTVAAKVLGPVVTDVEGLTVSPEELLPSGDTVVVIVRYTGSGKVTRKPLDLTATHVWDVHDGKVIRFREFIDTVKFLEVVPEDAATHG